MDAQLDSQLSERKIGLLTVLILSSVDYRGVGVRQGWREHVDMRGSLIPDLYESVLSPGDVRGVIALINRFLDCDCDCDGAERRGFKIGTVRSQVRAVLEKSG